MLQYRSGVAPVLSNDGRILTVHTRDIGGEVVTIAIGMMKAILRMPVWCLCPFL